jgi:hypothetical protein
MGLIGLQRMVDELEWKHQVPKLLKAYAGSSVQKKSLAGASELRELRK